MRAWFYISGQTDSSTTGAIIKTLKESPIEIYPLTSYTHSGPGILIFDSIDPNLCDFLRNVSRSGIERVLAVAVSRTVLSDHRCWHLLKWGASDVLAWDHFTDPIAEVLARFERWESIDSVIRSPLVQNNLMGQSVAWTSVLRQGVEAAKFTDAYVLLTGETGTGKELVARLIHTLDERPKKGDLIILDCTTIVPELSGSEFFGHERGAFTGAVASREGAFELANRGTLFLDEVGELSLNLQAQLLRVIQEGTCKRVGGNVWQQTKFRLVCATNRDLLQEVMRGKFRRDLYYRIAAVSIKLPPIRERREDILPLVSYFMKPFHESEDPPDLHEPVRAYLVKREYPGNVRELKQLVSRIIYRHVGSGPITIGDLPEEERPTEDSNIIEWYDEFLEKALRRAIHSGVGLKEIRRKITESAIRIGVDDEEGNLQRAARKLGVTSRALQIRRAARRGGELFQKINGTA